MGLRGGLQFLGQSKAGLRYDEPRILECAFHRRGPDWQAASDRQFASNLQVECKMLRRVSGVDLVVVSLAADNSVSQAVLGSVLVATFSGVG